MQTLEKGILLSNQQVGVDLWEMEIHAPQIAAAAQPGQIVNLRVSRLDSPLLRRPFSIYDAHPVTGTLLLLYKVVGTGTQLMTEFKAAEQLDLMGPLGKGFSLPGGTGKNLLLVGGGVGLAPLLLLGRRLVETQHQVTVLLGAGNASQVVGEKRFTDLNIKFLVSTIDGSYGFPGLVTDLLQARIEPQTIDFLYCCGPEAMMAAVSSYAVKNNIDGEVSLEENMACGVGACLGCARKLQADHTNLVKICHDGPVFPLNAVEFNNNQEAARCLYYL